MNLMMPYQPLKAEGILQEEATPLVAELYKKQHHECSCSKHKKGTPT
jgi:hypothetical protein